MSDAGVPDSGDRPLVANRPVIAHRMVQLGILCSIVWKVSYFHWSLTVYEAIPIKDSFFPVLLQSNVVLFVAYVVAVGASMVGLVTGSFMLKRLVAVASILSLTVLCLHQGSYNDATFTTCWWASLWTIWFVHRINREPAESLLPKAAFLGRAMVSMILLGGAMGKWTAEYWSGEVLHDIYFVNRPFWTFDVLRAGFDDQALFRIAKWYSRVVIVVETMAGLGLWLLPARSASIIAIVLLVSIPILSNFLLFSVMFSLIGLAAVGLVTKRPSCWGWHRSAGRSGRPCESSGLPT